MKRHPEASCSCGWRLARDGGFTAAEAREAWDLHRRVECPETRGVRLRGGMCPAFLLAGFSTALDCNLPIDHEGDHRSFGGSSWGQ